MRNRLNIGGAIPRPGRESDELARPNDAPGLDLQGKAAGRILVINCGSSSLKYRLHDTSDESVDAVGLVERVGLDGTRLTHRCRGHEVHRNLLVGGFAEALLEMQAELMAEGTGILQDAGEVGVIAHRVVHGGERFTEATLVTDEVIGEIEKLNSLAPLHNPVNIAGIREMRRLFPAATHVAVFDTAFHAAMPEYAYLYGLPYELYERHGVRRYGFHGTSHRYASLRAAEFLDRHADELRLITCHLGNGSSVCAIDRGRSVDTSMGFTPAEGLIMGTRCGDIDPGLPAFLERAEGLPVSESEELFNRSSGLLGLSGISSDMREILAAAGAGQRRARLAIEAYCYRVRKYIGACFAVLGGLDALVLTGGIGQGSAEIRARITRGLDCLGIALDERRNQDARGFSRVCRVSADPSRVAMLVVPADEEWMMAREALEALGGRAVGGCSAKGAGLK